MRNDLLSCDVVADFFLLQIDELAGDTISNLKLQKLCYYAQAWSLALDNEPLFSERIEAWAHGPAIPELYRRFKKYGSQAIDPSDRQTDPIHDLHTEHLNLLSGVWHRYGRLSGNDLRTMTHHEEPWLKARGSTPPGENCNAAIAHESMRSFYRRQRLEYADDADSRAKAS